MRESKMKETEREGKRRGGMRESERLIRRERQGRGRG